MQSPYALAQQMHTTRMCACCLPGLCHTTQIDECCCPPAAAQINPRTLLQIRNFPVLTSGAFQNAIDTGQWTAYDEFSTFITLMTKRSSWIIRKHMVGRRQHMFGGMNLASPNGHQPFSHKGREKETLLQTCSLCITT